MSHRCGGHHCPPPPIAAAALRVLAFALTLAAALVELHCGERVEALVTLIFVTAPLWVGEYRLGSDLIPVSGVTSFCDSGSPHLDLCGHAVAA